MDKQTPIIAFLYDFDKTLCTTDMEDYAFIPALGYTPAEFWAKANSFGWSNRMDGLLAYMYTMIQECAAQSIKLDRAFLNRCGASIQLFPGVREGFGRINAFAKSLGVQVEHYVISSGLREIIEGSGIAHEFREIYACEFYYNGTVMPAGRSWTSTSPTKRSSFTASTRAFWTFPGIRSSMTPCRTIPSGSRLPI